MRSGPRPPCLRGWVAQARWEKWESVDAAAGTDETGVAMRLRGMRTDKSSVDRLELGERVVEREDLRRADEGEIAVAQRVRKRTPVENEVTHSG